MKDYINNLLKHEENLKLRIEMVPQTAWYNNLRFLLKAKQWDLIRRECYDKANGLCEICGGKGNKHPVECHEIWEYDPNLYGHRSELTQKLNGVIALCPKCHKCKHWGFWSEVKKQEKSLINHFCKVNDIDIEKAKLFVVLAYGIFSDRSKKKWKLDLKWIEDNYDKSFINQCNKKIEELKNE